MERFDRQYTVDEVFYFVKTNNGDNKKLGKIRVEFDGHMMKPYSLRYLTFMNGCTCVSCNLKGLFFVKERTSTIAGNPNDNGGYHFNLYALNKNNKEVLMTKDHVLAKALGGKDVVENMQTMCTECNGIKSSMTVDQWETYQKTGEFPEDYHSRQADPNSKRSQKKATKEDWITKQNDPAYQAKKYAELKELADKHGKQVYIYPTLNNRLAIAKGIDRANKQFTGHKAELYKGDSDGN